jgi:hypothetical protein
MGFVSKRVALALLVFICVGTLSAQPPVSAALPHHRPAGCHQHDQKAPDPQPVSYGCCVAGHDSAILQPSAVSAPSPLVSLAVVVSGSPVQATVISRDQDLPVSSGRPPGITALRI